MCVCVCVEVPACTHVYVCERVHASVCVRASERMCVCVCVLGQWQVQCAKRSHLFLSLQRVTHCRLMQISSRSASVMMRAKDTQIYINI